MAESNLLSGLKRKFAALTGEAVALEERIAKIKAEYELVAGLEAKLPSLREGAHHVAEVIRLMDSSWEESSVAPRKPFARRIPIPPGQCSRMAIDILRTASTAMGSREIALKVLERAGCSDADTHVRVRVTNAVDATLRQYRERGLVQSDDSWPMKWSVTPPV